MGDVPLGPEEITLDWLNATLAEHGFGVASEFSVSPFGEIGVYGRLVRVDLRYPGGQPDRSLVAKFALADEEARLALAEIGIYAREYRFYSSELAGLSPIPVPRCYFAYFDAEAQHTCLLIELVVGESGDEVSGASQDRAALASRQAGRLHAFWYTHPALRENDWLDSFTSGDFVDSLVSATQSAAEEGCQRLSGMAPDWLLVRGSNAGRIVGDQLEALAGLPETLIHLDFRLPNMIFQGTGMSLIDWQSVMKGPGVVDLGLFCFHSLTVEDRRAWQDRLVNGYCEAAGVENREAFDVALRRIALFLAFNTIRNAPVVDLSRPQMALLWPALTERAYAAVEDLHALELI